nr:MAG TPA: hypothetical protein [Caudoviricetes sp.]
MVFKNTRIRGTRDTSLVFIGKLETPCGAR